MRRLSVPIASRTAMPRHKSIPLDPGIVIRVNKIGVFW
jgi:hypothetical protein